MNEDKLRYHEDILTGCDPQVEGHVDVPSGTAIIADQAFWNCAKITSISLPKGIKRIGSKAFAGCSQMDSIILHNGMIAICPGAFYKCEKLTRIVIPEGITSIWDASFAECRGLSSVKIPQSVIEIVDYAFAYCESLREIALPDNLETIANGAFFNCVNLSKIVIPYTVSKIGSYAFAACNGLKEVHCRWKTIDYLYIDGHAFYDNDGVVNPEAVLYVPKGCEEQYAAHPAFAMFKSIVGEADPQASDFLAEEMSAPNTNGDYKAHCELFLCDLIKTAQEKMEEEDLKTVRELLLLYTQKKHWINQELQDAIAKLKKDTVLPSLNITVQGDNNGTIAEQITQQPDKKLLK